jgi:putative transcriptional regulator
MEALHDVGAVDKQTMRRFDDACLTPIRPLKPEEIKAIRERERVSQTVFANYLNVASSLVSKWERGEKRPSGASLKLLSLVEKNGLATVAESHHPAARHLVRDCAHATQIENHVAFLVDVESWGEAGIPDDLVEAVGVTRVEISNLRLPQ